MQTPWILSKWELSIVQINQYMSLAKWWKCREFAFLKYFTLSFHIMNKLLIANEHLVAGTRLEDILGGTFIYTVGQRATRGDANHIHKVRYSI